MAIPALSELQMKKKNGVDVTSNLNQEIASPERDVETLQNNLQEIANFCAVCQTLMQHHDIQDPRILQCIFKALCLIEELTYCKGNGSLEFWTTKFAED